MSVAADAPRRIGIFGWLFGALISLVFGTLLSLTAVTSLIVLGWLMRRMRFVAFGMAGLPGDRPGWILGSGGRIARLFGGLAANIREGILAAISLAIATAPFAVIWLLSWWAGWENSFSKGYEQAFVGPALGLGGVAVFCVTMVWLPMALAHQAAENRGFALFELKRVRSAVRHSGWGYLFLALATVIAALPIFASRGLVVFASGIVPGFDDMSVDQIAGLQGGADLLVAAYVFVALVVLRGWAARVYARAVARALDGPEADLWVSSPLSDGKKGGNRPWRLTHWLRVLVLLAVWFGLAAQVFVGQFLNHDWHIWLTHPM
ncbi:MAG: hypothetical protein HKN02_12210, partial [Rhodobacteraceae bacterium]|nr:hypothetical protein [Paracoccaceae bacterium]